MTGGEEELAGTGSSSIKKGLCFSKGAIVRPTATGTTDRDRSCIGVFRGVKELNLLLWAKSFPTGFGPIAIRACSICCGEFSLELKGGSRCQVPAIDCACPSPIPLWEGSAVARSRQKSSMARQFATSQSCFPFIGFLRHGEPNNEKKRTAPLTVF